MGYSSFYLTSRAFSCAVNSGYTLNAFNQANFSYPNEIVFNGTAISPSAGVVTQTNGTSRQLQFALKLIF